EEYTSKTSTSFNPPMMGMGDKSSMETAKYQGDCPAGMKPGMIKTENGQVIDTVKMMENMPDLSAIDNMMQGMEKGQMPSQADMQKMMEAMKQAQQAQ
ncbi:MAG: hypothetical protein KDD62_07195, partial [Bdellovibrionales bacterium]|nr:hypothetical protein [Bdellovibrionales bacterium]